MSVASSWPSIPAAARTSAAGSAAAAPAAAARSRDSMRGWEAWAAPRRRQATRSGLDPRRTDVTLAARPGAVRSPGRGDGGRSRQSTEHPARPTRRCSGLPPGPRMARALQTAIWSRRAQWMLEQCRARFGSMFTLNIAYEGTWVMVSDPEHVKQVFTGDPRVFHAGEGNQILRPSSARTRSWSSTRSRTSASASCCCRPSTASACRATARRWPRSPPARSRAGRPAPPTSCGRGCRRSPSRSSSRPSSASTAASGWSRCATALRDFLDLTTNPLLLAAGRPGRPEPDQARSPAFRRRIDRVDELIHARDRRAPGRRGPRRARRHPLDAGRRPATRTAAR